MGVGRPAPPSPAVPPAASAGGLPSSGAWNCGRGGRRRVGGGGVRGRRPRKNLALAARQEPPTFRFIPSTAGHAVGAACSAWFEQERLQDKVRRLGGSRRWGSACRDGETISGSYQRLHGPMQGFPAPRLMRSVLGPSRACCSLSWPSISSCPAASHEK